MKGKHFISDLKFVHVSPCHVDILPPPPNAYFSQLIECNNVNFTICDISITASEISRPIKSLDFMKARILLKSQ